jgi:hypothetical protein
VSPEQRKRKDQSADDGDRTDLLDVERPLDVWSRCAPIRLAGYEDDPTETHILRGID